jgi:hypothetical protein
MNSLFWRLAPEALLGIFLVGAVGCEPNNGVPAGPPVLKSFSVIDPMNGAVELTVDGAAVTVSPQVHLVALFDRLLDGAAVTDIDPDGGADLGRTDLATIVATPGGSPTSQSIYTPNGGPVGLFFAQGPSITVNAVPTFPAGSTVTVTLDKTRIHSKAGQPFTGEGDLADGKLVFTTDDLSATITPPNFDPDGGTSNATIAFNNLVDPTTLDQITMTVDTGIGPTAFTAFTATVDPSDPTVVIVAPTAGWPAASTFTINVGANVADVMGVKLGTAGATSATFPTS